MLPNAAEWYLVVQNKLLEYQLNGTGDTRSPQNCTE